MGQIIILSGPPRSGKSAIAEALCERYDRMAHVDVGALGAMIRMGRLRPWDQTPDGRRQRELLIHLACDFAHRFAQAEYGVIVEDIVLPEDLALYLSRLPRRAASAHFVLLLPELAIVTSRERDVPSEWRGRIEGLYHQWASWSGICSLDPDGRSPIELADQVMQLVGEGSARMC